MPRRQVSVRWIVLGLAISVTGIGCRANRCPLCQQSIVHHQEMPVGTTIVTPTMPTEVEHYNAPMPTPEPATAPPPAPAPAEISTPVPQQETVRQVQPEPQPEPIPAPVSAPNFNDATSSPNRLQELQPEPIPPSDEVPVQEINDSATFDDHAPIAPILPEFGGPALQPQLANEVVATGMATAMTPDDVDAPVQVEQIKQSQPTHLRITPRVRYGVKSAMQRLKTLRPVRLGKPIIPTSSNGPILPGAEKVETTIEFMSFR